MRVAGMETDLGDEIVVHHRNEITSLIHTHEAPLYRFLAALTGNKEIALDCVQDTFIRAYEHPQRGKSVNTQWLYKVARNRAIDEMRRNKRVAGDNDLFSQFTTPTTDLSRQAFVPLEAGKPPKTVRNWYN